MLRRTFVMVPGIGPRTERQLWTTGVQDWQATTFPVAPRLHERIRGAVKAAEEALSGGDARYFCRCLPTSEHWRICGEFRDRIAFFDIETTGLSPRRDQITVIGLADSRGKIQTFVRGENLDQFTSVVDQYAVLVTYNGKQFDVPFLEQQLGWRPRAAHIDLRFGLAALGFRGGLKSVQSRLGFFRPDGMADLDGRAAVWLWRRYQRTGDPAYRDILVQYCLCDVVALVPLLGYLYRERSARTPFPDRLDLPVPPVPLPDRPTCLQVLDEYRRAVNRQTTGISQDFLHGP